MTAELQRASTARVRVLGIRLHWCLDLPDNRPGLKIATLGGASMPCLFHVRRSFVCATFVALASVAAAAEPAGASTEKDASPNWPSWRGPAGDGHCAETGLLRSWNSDGLPLLWKASGLGKGFSSVAIQDGHAFTMGARRGKAHLIALDLDSRKEVWSIPVGKGKPNSTPTIDGSRIYALGREGDLVCTKTKNGKELWRKDFAKDFGGKMMSSWGYSESPHVDGNRLICTPGGNDAVIVALDKKTGAEVWRAKLPDNAGDRGKDGAGYASIVVSEAAGVRQYLQLVGRGVISVAASDGRFLWSYNRIANDVANIPSPIARGNKVFCSTGYGTGAALLEIVKGKGDTLEAKESYFLKSKQLQNHHGGMVLVGDHVYCGHGHNKGYPRCIDLATGEVVWGEKVRGPGSGSAAILYADDHLYFRYEDGVVALVEATPKKYELKGSFEMATKNGKSWPHPVIAGGKLYLRDQQDLLCYSVTGKHK